MEAVTEHNLSDRDYQTLSDLVYKHCGINLHDGKKELVRARMAKRIRTAGFASVRSYIETLTKDTDGEEFHHFVDAISTNLTSFFRESDHFDHLREVFLPRLMQLKAKQRDNRLRAWSAGCSTGEEPYTITMTVLETIEKQGAWDYKLLATDISRPVLNTARTGIYDAVRAKGIPAALKGKYFDPHPVNGKTGFRAGEALRRCIRFNYLNLMEPWPFKGPFDFIFCRNVMIYFDKPTQQRLIQRYHDVLSPGGLLFTGHSESLTGIKHRFGYVQPTIYVKT